MPKSRKRPSTMMSQTTRKTMSLAEIDFIAGSCSERVIESSLRLSSLSQPQEESILKKKLHTSQLRLFSTTKTTGLTLNQPEKLVKLILT
jgi:hypothetical protein